jgi:hypothetical protein
MLTLDRPPGNGGLHLGGRLAHGGSMQHTDSRLLGAAAAYIWLLLVLTMAS